MEPREEQAMAPGSGTDKIDGLAILSYIGILFVVPLLAGGEDDFRKFHAKQGLVLFLAEIVSNIVWVVPVLGWLAGVVLYIGWVALSVVGILNVVKSKKEPLPVIGEFAERFKV